MEIYWLFVYANVLPFLSSQRILVLFCIITLVTPHKKSCETWDHYPTPHPSPCSMGPPRVLDSCPRWPACCRMAQSPGVPPWCPAFRLHTAAARPCPCGTHAGLRKPQQKLCKAAPRTPAPLRGCRNPGESCMEQLLALPLLPHSHCACRHLVKVL